LKSNWIFTENPGWASFFYDGVISISSGPASMFPQLFQGDSDLAVVLPAPAKKVNENPAV
jgi:hypothetical protein